MVSRNFDKRFMSRGELARITIKIIVRTLIQRLTGRTELVRFAKKKASRDFETKVYEPMLVCTNRYQNVLTRLRYKGLSAGPSSPVWRSKLNNTTLKQSQNELSRNLILLVSLRLGTSSPDLRLKWNHANRKQRFKSITELTASLRNTLTRL